MMCRFESCSGHREREKTKVKGQKYFFLYTFIFYLDSRPDGEIGRHASLRGWCSQGCASSSLVLGTKKAALCSFFVLLGFPLFLRRRIILFLYRFIYCLQNIRPDIHVVQKDIVPCRIYPVAKKYKSYFFFRINPNKGAGIT
jgi:hypothetical protein